MLLAMRSGASSPAGARTFSDETCFALNAQPIEDGHVPDAMVGGWQNIIKGDAVCLAAHELQVTGGQQDPRRGPNNRLKCCTMLQMH